MTPRVAERSKDLGAAESADSAGLIGIGGGIVGDDKAAVFGLSCAVSTPSDAMQGKYYPSNSLRPIMQTEARREHGCDGKLGPLAVLLRRCMTSIPSRRGPHGVPDEVALSDLVIGRDEAVYMYSSTARRCNWEFEASGAVAVKQTAYRRSVVKYNKGPHIPEVQTPEIRSAQRAVYSSLLILSVPLSMRPSVRSRNSCKCTSIRSTRQRRTAGRLVDAKGQELDETLLGPASSLPKYIQAGRSSVFLSKWSPVSFGPITAALSQASWTAHTGREGWAGRWSSFGRDEDTAHYPP
ncbi:hypothetical protein DFH06DRAFT_1152133 [Mycena polygramma]|nr:hypothetical protein DFH06DRAFT_1152133 [Mycena polygramma]